MICLDILCTSRPVKSTRKRNDEYAQMKLITVCKRRQGEFFCVLFSFRMRSLWAYTQTFLVNVSHQLRVGLNRLCLGRPASVERRQQEVDIVLRIARGHTLLICTLEGPAIPRAGLRDCLWRAKLTARALTKCLLGCIL